jgi:hypothetical protein
VETDAAGEAQLNISKDPSNDGDDEQKEGPLSVEDDKFSDKDSDIL